MDDCLQRIICPNFLHSLGDAPSDVPRMQSHCPDEDQPRELPPTGGSRGQMLLSGQESQLSPASSQGVDAYT